MISQKLENLVSKAALDLRNFQTLPERWTFLDKLSEIQRTVRELEEAAPKRPGLRLSDRLGAAVGLMTYGATQDAMTFAKWCESVSHLAGLVAEVRELEIALAQAAPAGEASNVISLADVRAARNVEAFLFGEHGLRATATPFDSLEALPPARRPKHDPDRGGAA